MNAQQFWRGVARFRATRTAPHVVTLAPGDIVLRDAERVYVEAVGRTTVRLKTTTRKAKMNNEKWNFKFDDEQVILLLDALDYCRINLSNDTGQCSKLGHYFARNNVYRRVVATQKYITDICGLTPSETLA